MDTETPISNSDWDYPFTDDELQAIDAAFSAASSSASPIKKRHRLSCTDAGASTDCPPKTRRRLPESLFAFRRQQKNDSSLSFSLCSRNLLCFDRNYYNRSPFRGSYISFALHYFLAFKIKIRFRTATVDLVMVSYGLLLCHTIWFGSCTLNTLEMIHDTFSPFSFHKLIKSKTFTLFAEIKFGGCIVYSRTVEEVERASEELLKFVEANKRKEIPCILGLDIEWRPTFRRGVAPGKAAVMQICGENNRCHVFHIIHSQIPIKLRCLLEDHSSLKVGVCVANDASKILQDYSVQINTLGDLSDLASQKLGGDPKKWSLSTLTEMLICRQLPKPSKIRLGNWEIEVLSKEQLNYAATDAYVSWYLYQVLKYLPDPTDNKNV